MLAPVDHWQNLESFLAVWGWMLLSADGQRPGMLLNIIQCAGRLNDKD